MLRKPPTAVGGLFKSSLCFRWYVKLPPTVRWWDSIELNIALVGW